MLLESSKNEKLGKKKGFGVRTRGLEESCWIQRRVVTDSGIGVPCVLALSEDTALCRETIIMSFAQLGDKGLERHT